MATHALLQNIIIDENNKYLDIWEAGGGAQVVTLTEGTYDDIHDLLDHIQAQIRAKAGNWAAATVSLDHDPDLGRVVFAVSGVTFSLLWKTGTHGSDNDDDHVGTVLGYSDAADDTGAQTYTSDNQHQYGWYAPHGPAFDSQDMPVVLGAPPVIVTAGFVRRVTNPNTLDDRVMRWEAIAAAYWHPDDSATNEDFVTWWRAAARGRPFQYYTDVENETSEGTFAMIDPVERLGASMARESAGSAYFALTMTWQKDPT